MGPTLAVCIPCAYKDIHYLPYCLKSIESQTIKPEMIVVSISECNDTLDISSNIPIHFLVSKSHQYAGKNRNLAAKKAVDLGAEILSFFDADDIMHPKRLESIKTIFLLDPNSAIVLHSNMVGPKSDLGVYKGTTPIPWKPLSLSVMKDIFEIERFRRFSKLKFKVGITFPSEFQITNGHTSVLSMIWKENPFNEIFHVAEDCLFNAELFIKGHQVVYTPDCLSLYQRGECKGFQ
jgi:glycosyltransferase involved in cell wall biosynthesis